MASKLRYFSSYFPTFLAREWQCNPLGAIVDLQCVHWGACFASDELTLLHDEKWNPFFLFHHKQPLRCMFKAPRLHWQKQKKHLAQCENCRSVCVLVWLWWIWTNKLKHQSSTITNKLYFCPPQPASAAESFIYSASMLMLFCALQASSLCIRQNLLVSFRYLEYYTFIKQAYASNSNHMEW